MADMSLIRRLMVAGAPDDLVDEVAGLLSDVRALENAVAKSRDRTARYRQRRDLSDKEWAALTALVIERDGWVCTYCDCDTSNPENGYAIDHEMPLAKGGSNDIDNLTMSCRSCNCSKGDRILDDEWTPPNDDFQRWQRGAQ